MTDPRLYLALVLAYFVAVPLVGSFMAGRHLGQAIAHRLTRAWRRRS